MNVIRLLSLSNVKNASMMKRAFSSDVYEPDYLDALKPILPLYDSIHVQIRGYDFAILENYQALIHSISKNMEIDVEDGWALPPQQMQINTLKPNSAVVSSLYNLKIYQRSIKLTDVFSTQLPLLIRAIEACTPAGVTVNVSQHASHHDEERYIPDKDLLNLKQELDEMGGVKKTK